jgi:AraC-like DNA-binding protein
MLCNLEWWPLADGIREFPCGNGADCLLALLGSRDGGALMIAERAPIEAGSLKPRAPGDRLDLSVAGERAITHSADNSTELAVVTRRRPLELQTWRLRRVQAHIHNHMSEVIELADLARAAGLSRSYFAAQFRARMLVRPHEYVVSQRIARAQALLREPHRTISDVALQVGFPNQAHFTTIFRHYVGITPYRWRHSNV